MWIGQEPEPISIHPTAIISPKAEFGQNVSIGAYTIIEDNVKIGDETKIGNHNTICNGTSIGSNCKIFHNTSIGEAPQDLKYDGEETLTFIGDNVKIRESVTINKGTNAFGKTINKYQALRHRFADLHADMEICKTYNYAVTQKLNSGDYVVKEATISKLRSTKMADEVVYECLQFLGGYGYMEEYPMARLFRDSRLGPIGGGTSEILREIIAKIVIDKKDYKPIT